MLIYFHHNKAKYNKGQLAPFFILILVVLIIMALVTVNLSKVAFIKTDSSNAADSGALAAGSAMANTFNAIAQANSALEAAYIEFIAVTSILFTVAIVALVIAIITGTGAKVSGLTAAALSCDGTCPAIVEAVMANTLDFSATGLIKIAISLIKSIITSVTAYAIAQHYYYLQIRRTAGRGRWRALSLGHRYVFMNSGIGAKLKEGSPPTTISEVLKRNNYRDSFSGFFERLSYHGEQFRYDWQDGQDRMHFVQSDIDIDPVDDFELRVAINPLLVELAVLFTALTLGSSAIGVSILYFIGVILLIVACICWACQEVPIIGAACAACWAALCAAATALLVTSNVGEVIKIGLIWAMLPVLAVAWAGLAPGPVYTSSSDIDDLPFIITWIDDIDHNRLVRVDTTQHHEGADLGLWQTRYPDIHSYSVVNFKGGGEIYPPELRHDASIVQTD